MLPLGISPSQNSLQNLAPSLRLFTPQETNKMPGSEIIALG
jgi:hypothetical protein